MFTRILAWDKWRKFCLVQTVADADSPDVMVWLMRASRRRMPAIRWAACSVLSAVPTAWQKLLESSELRQVPLNLNLLWFDAMATWNVVLNFQPMMA